MAGATAEELQKRVMEIAAKAGERDRRGQLRWIDFSEPRWREEDEWEDRAAS